MDFLLNYNSFCFSFNVGSRGSGGNGDGGTGDGSFDGDAGDEEDRKNSGKSLLLTIYAILIGGKMNSVVL